MPPPLKAIPPARDRLQSRLLVAIVVSLLMPYLIEIAITLAIDLDDYRTFHQFSEAFGLIARYRLSVLGVSVAFALIAWLLRSATPWAALCGGVICFHLASYFYSFPPSLLRSPLPALIGLFLLTSFATRFRRAKKETAGTAEARTGRRASQVIANLGFAALCCAPANMAFHHYAGYLPALAALAEATADTLSSEIGQGIAGRAFLVTSLRRVPPGTDGAVSLAGTLAGLAGAALIVLAGLPHPFWGFTPLLSAAAFLAAAAGLFFDSLLGDTLERRGWIGNDLVNFFSTAFAAAVSYSLLLFALHFLRV